MLTIFARASLVLTLVMLSAPVAAQSDGPYKLIITWFQSGIVVIDYPSKARCERASQAVLERMMEKAKRAGLPQEGGDIAFCIPG